MNWLNLLPHGQLGFETNQGARAYRIGFGFLYSDHLDSGISGAIVMESVPGAIATGWQLIARLDIGTIFLPGRYRSRY